MVNLWNFTDYQVSVTMAKICYYSINIATDIPYDKSGGIPVKLPLQKQMTAILADKLQFAGLYSRLKSLLKISLLRRYSVTHGSLTVHCTEIMITVTQLTGQLPKKTKIPFCQHEGNVSFYSWSDG